MIEWSITSFSTWPVMTLSHLAIAGVALLGGLAAPVPVRAEEPVPGPLVAAAAR